MMFQSLQGAIQTVARRLADRCRMVGFNPFKVRSKPALTSKSSRSSRCFNPFKVRSKQTITGDHSDQNQSFNPFKVRSKRMPRDMPLLRYEVSIPSRYDPNLNTTAIRFDRTSFQSLQGTIQTPGQSYHFYMHVFVSIPSRYDPNQPYIVSVYRPCKRFNPFKVRSKRRKGTSSMDDFKLVSIPSRYDPNL